MPKGHNCTGQKDVQNNAMEYQKVSSNRPGEVRSAKGNKQSIFFYFVHWNDALLEQLGRFSPSIRETTRHANPKCLMGTWFILNNISDSKSAVLQLLAPRCQFSIQINNLEYIYNGIQLDKKFSKKQPMKNRGREIEK
jgi:hypothetical protein